MSDAPTRPFMPFGADTIVIPITNIPDEMLGRQRLRWQTGATPFRDPSIERIERESAEQDRNFWQDLDRAFPPKATRMTGSDAKSSVLPAGARIVFDKNGNPIVNQRTGDGLLAPDDWTPQKAIQFGHDLKAGYDLALISTGDVGSASLAEDAALALAYRSGAQFDLQMNYNGNQGRGPFNRRYTDAAAYSFGLTAAAAGYSFEQAAAGAGIYNLLKSRSHPEINTEGYWGNDPERVRSIRQGFEDYSEGRFGR